MIHYHGTPITPNRSLIAMRGKHFFVSFFRPDNIGIVADISSTFAIDNGAFSAWTMGAEIDIEKYKDFVRQWTLPNCDFHIIPDIIDGRWEDNQELVDNWDLPRSAPVWHLHEPLEYLEYLTRFPLVCIGSSKAYSKIGTSLWWGRIAQAMDVLCVDGLPKTKIHGLRMLDNKLRAIPFYSADSTNVAQNGWKGESKFGISKEAMCLILCDRIELEQASLKWTKQIEDVRTTIIDWLFNGDKAEEQHNKGEQNGK